MAKKKKTQRTVSQLKRDKRLQHFNNSAKLARRSKRQLPGWKTEGASKSNYKNLGIVIDANEATSKVRPRSILHSGVPGEYDEEDEGLVVIPAEEKSKVKKGTLTDYLEKVKNMPKLAQYEVKSMNPQEQYILQDLIRKHGNNYEKMARDTKINVYQHTARYLEKRIELLNRLFDKAEAEERAAQAAAEAEAETEDAEDVAEDLAIEQEAEAEMLEQIKNDPEFLKLVGEAGADDMLDGAKLSKNSKKSKESSVPKTIADLQNRILKQLRRDAADAQRRMEEAVQKAIQEEKRGPVEIKVSGDRVAITGEKLTETKGAANRGSRAWKSGGDVRVKYTGGRIYRFLAPKLIRILPAVEKQKRKFFRKEDEIDAAKSIKS